ncbi:MAG: energy-coupling factor transporter ATPase, partial [Cetobacterium sp.]
LNGLLEPFSGKIFVDEVDITGKDVKLADIRKRVGLVFQYPEYQLFEETIEKDISYGPKNLGLSEEVISKRVKLSMEMVGLDYDTYKDISPFELSGGQKRRVAIAGVIAMEPKVLILDEPTAGLDPKGREDILAQIKILHEEYNMTIILVSHSMEDVGKLAERIVVMNKGKIALEGKPSEVFKEIETLESIGLGVPQVTYLMRELSKRGFNVSQEIFTVEQGKLELLKVLNSDK